MINGKSICCDNCKNWFDIKCSKIGNGDEFEALSLSKNERQCKICTKEIFPFRNLDNKRIKALLGTQGTRHLTKNKKNTHNLKPNEPQVALPKLNFAEYKRDKYDFYSDIDGNTNLNINFKFYDTTDFNEMTKALDPEKKFSLLHTNIFSLIGNGEKLE